MRQQLWPLAGIVSFTKPLGRPERVHIVPRMGDVIVDNKGQTYRLILNTKYPIPDLSRWLDYTKNKPTMLLGTSEVSEALNKYATGEIPQKKQFLFWESKKINLLVEMLTVLEQAYLQRTKQSSASLVQNIHKYAIIKP